MWRNPGGKRQLERSGFRCEGNSTTYHKEIDGWRAELSLVSLNWSNRSANGQLRNYRTLRRKSAP